MPKPMRILLVDDHAVVRAGFKTLLENQGDMSVIAEAQSGGAACRQFIEHAPDVVSSTDYTEVELVGGHIGIYVNAKTRAQLVATVVGWSRPGRSCHPKSGGTQ